MTWCVCVSGWGVVRVRPQCGCWHPTPEESPPCVGLCAGGRDQASASWACFLKLNLSVESPCPWTWSSCSGRRVWGGKGFACTDVSTMHILLDQPVRFSSTDAMDTQDSFEESQQLQRRGPRWGTWGWIPGEGERVQEMELHRSGRRSVEDSREPAINPCTYGQLASQRRRDTMEKRQTYQ